MVAPTCNCHVRRVAASAVVSEKHPWNPDFKPVQSPLGRHGMWAWPQTLVRREG
ncbi:hypothetical protein ACWC10_38335 [Streptomyces sp. NPDC001595]|uniref:hypothetical protein n=1 Tax=Streptomyces sp. NPDC001532 TaxID=3154520 RepID=UPI0033325F1E